MNKTTNELENEFMSVDSPEKLKAFLHTNHIGKMTFGDKLIELCDKYQVKKADILKKTAISKAHLYAIENGTRKPGREQVIRIAIALGLTVEEVNELLKLSGHKELYVKNQEDNIILYGMKNKKDIYEIQELLSEYHCKLSLLDKE